MNIQPRDLLGLYKDLNIEAVPTTLADDLRELMVSTAGWPLPDNTMAFFTEQLRDILRKHGEAEE